MSNYAKIAHYKHRETLLKHWRIGLLGAVVSLAAVYFVVRQMDVRLLGDAFAHAQYIYLLPSAALIVLGLGARAVRWRVLLSGYFPAYAYDLGSLDTRLPFAELKARSLINGKAHAADGDLAFSARIREGLPRPDRAP